jgi:hypothetical protein
MAQSALKQRLRILLQHGALYVGRRPRLKVVVLRILNRMPSVKSRVARFVLGMAATRVLPRDVPKELAHLTPRARQIHADLITAFGQRNSDNL